MQVSLSNHSWDQTAYLLTSYSRDAGVATNENNLIYPGLTQSSQKTGTTGIWSSNLGLYSKRIKLLAKQLYQEKLIEMWNTQNFHKLAPLE